MNKRQPSSAYLSPVKRPGKKRKANSTTASQTDDSPTKHKAPILDPDSWPWPKNAATLTEMIDLREDETESTFAPRSKQTPSTLIAKDAAMQEVHPVSDPELDHIMAREQELELPPLPVASNAEQDHAASHDFPTSEVTHASTDYYPSEMDIASDATDETSSPRTKVEKLISMVKDMDPDTLNEKKNDIIKRLNDLEAYDSTTPRAILEPELVQIMKNRLQAMEGAMITTVKMIPEDKWIVYRSRLIHLVEGRTTLNMDFQQRLSRIMDIVYMSEELGAMESGDWDRLEAAIRITASMAEVTGPEYEEVPEKAQMWVDSKLRDIAWLKKIVAIRDKYTDAAQTEAVMEEF